MPAIKKIAYTNIFSQLNNEAFAKGENNDCSVKAVALVTGSLYDVAHRALDAQGRSQRKGAYTTQIHAAIAALGKKVVQVNPRDIIALYPEPHRSVLKGITTHHPRRFDKVWPKGKYLLYSRRHVSAVIDGVLHDWAVNSARRVISVYEVV